jgi:hypothetical protein
MNQVGQHMAEDHREIEALLKRLAEDALAPECAALHCTWCELESRLLGHMAAEEQYLLPLLEASHPTEAARIFAEHSAMLKSAMQLAQSASIKLASGMSHQPPVAGRTQP